MSKMKAKEEHEVFVYVDCCIVRPSPLLLPLSWVLTPVQPFFPNFLLFSPSPWAANTCRLGPEARHNFFSVSWVALPDSV